MSDAFAPIVVVGAGVSGLACAAALRSGGEDVIVLERARGVGGRCATRRIEGQPVDFGIAFLHGSAPEFLAALAAVPAEALRGWPREILGVGRPCQPEAFHPGETRLAFREGVSAFPRHLARDLDVRLQTRVVALERVAGAMRLQLEGGSTLDARTLVLALASEQSQRLLATLPSAPQAVRAAGALLAMASSHPCLTLIARYAAGTPPPSWHAAYPERSAVIQLAVHDSAKRAAPAHLVLVLQAHAAWSRRHAEHGAWPALLLEEAGRLFGDWAAHPEATDPHRWKYARVDRSAELAAPMLLDVEGAGRVGLCGDRFASGPGVEAAWSSGTQLARRILEAR